MKVSQRLFLAVIPAVVGVVLVAALAYWGRLSRAAPEWVIVAAGVSVALSLALAWQNTRYVARRVERLASHRRPVGAGDELDSIETTVEQLRTAVTQAEATDRERASAVTRRLDEYAVLLSESAAAVRRHVEETRLAIHILLDQQFGSLNDHQDEFLQSARASTEAIEAELARLQEIAELDRGMLAGRRDAVRISDLVRALRPQLSADAARMGATIAVTVVPGPSPVRGDRSRLQQALELVLRHLVRRSRPGDKLELSSEGDRESVRVTLQGAPAPDPDADLALARRIIEGHGGRIEVNDRGTVVILPVVT